jgi:aminoglycoside phosphotransferase (APT) family kinase protein
VTARVITRSWNKRAVIAYVTAGPQGDGPPLIAKVYTDPQRAERVHAVLEQLYALSVAGHACAVPRPVAHLPEFGMSVYEAVRGCTLDRLETGGRREAMIAAGRWLSALHGSTIELVRRFDMTRESRKLGTWAEQVAHDHPPAAAMTARLIGRLDSLATRVQVSTATPIHKDFHYQHVLVDDGRARVIDLDEVRTGDPAFDVAHFRVNLRLLALREGMPADELARLDGAFLDGYATRYEADLRDELFRVYTCLKIAWQLVLGRGPAPLPTGAELSRQLELILEEGLR